uniref:Chemokine interleukin-8-like domain-containing protein n=1 Tax=Meleagris gallopavo TaxID=9103 RepID=A0A803XV46_MELGA
KSGVGGMELGSSYLFTCAPTTNSVLSSELRCRCVRAVAERIPPRHLFQVELVPEGATTKQGQTLCLSPSLPWVKLLVARFLSRYLTRAENLTGGIQSTSK